MALSTYWTDHIDAWQQSGLNQATYCRRQNLNYHTFSARLCDYRKIQKGSLPALIPVQITTQTNEYIMLKLGKGHQVDLPASISASWLAELLRCLD